MLQAIDVKSKQDAEKMLKLQSARLSREMNTLSRRQEKINGKIAKVRAEVTSAKTAQRFANAVRTQSERKMFSERELETPACGSTSHRR
jgi:hypothetical protein